MPESPAIVNGRSQLGPWILGTLATAILGIVTGTINTVQNHAGRIAALEALQNETRAQIQRIDHKLDRILEVQNGKR